MIPATWMRCSTRRFATGRNEVAPGRSIETRDSTRSQLIDQAEITVGCDISPAMIDQVWFGTAAARVEFATTNGHMDRPRLLFRDPREWWRPQP